MCMCACVRTHMLTYLYLSTTVCKVEHSSWRVGVGGCSKGLGEKVILVAKVISVRSPFINLSFDGLVWERIEANPETDSRPWVS